MTPTLLKPVKSLFVPIPRAVNLLLRNLETGKVMEMPSQRDLRRMRNGYSYPHARLANAAGQVVFDPRSLGYDLRLHDGEMQAVVPSDVLDYASAGQDSIVLPRDALITAIDLSADPYRDDVTTATITVVQDAVDKVISALSIAGGPTYFSLNSTLCFLKALANLNKVVYGGGVVHEDIATAVANDVDSYQAWRLQFGALSDYNPLDITAGIPAALLTSLNLNATFGANNLIATTAANGTIDTNTDIYAMVYGVQGLPGEYLQKIPKVNFYHDHITTVTANTDFRLPAGKGNWLKRMTILNLAVNASNNEPRNDSNITSLDLSLRKGATSKVFDTIRWRIFKNMASAWGGRGPENDRDGSVAVMGSALDGVAVVDFRKLTGNPFGMNLDAYGRDETLLRLAMATTTGSVHVFWEQYTLEEQVSRMVAERWPGFMSV